MPYVPVLLKTPGEIYLNWCTNMRITFRPTVKVDRNFRAGSFIRFQENCIKFFLRRKKPDAKA
jgi:hypothetical protein